MNPISASFSITPATDITPETATCTYVGPSFDDARTALATAIAGGSNIGWLIQNLTPSSTMRGGDPVKQERTEYMQPLIYDVESAIGLSKLPDGRTVIAGDEE